MPRKQVARLRPKQSRAETENSVRVPRAQLSPVLLFPRSLANLFAATSPYLPVKAIKPLPLARFGLFAYWRRQHAHPPWRLSPPILSDPIRRSVEAGEPSTRRSPQVRFYRTLPNNVSLSQKPRGFASSRRTSLRPHARCVRCRSPEALVIPAGSRARSSCLVFALILQDQRIASLVDMAARERCDEFKVGKHPEELRQEQRHLLFGHAFSEAPAARHGFVYGS